MDSVVEETGALGHGEKNPGSPAAVETEALKSLTCNETLEELSNETRQLLEISSDDQGSDDGVNYMDRVEKVSSAPDHGGTEMGVDSVRKGAAEATPTGDTAPKVSPEETDQNHADSQGDQQREESEAKPEPKFSARQRVYARDEVTGLLYEAIVRRVMWGPKSKQLNIYVEDPDKVPLRGESDDEDEEPEWCWNYFVHYQGWNTKWDRWVQESCLFEVSEGNKKLADRLKAELKEMKKLGKVGRRARDSDVVAARRRMRQLEEERREEERKEELRKQGILVEEAKTEEKTEVDPKEEEEMNRAFEVFSTEISPKITVENASATPEDISKLIAGKWKHLEKDERERYIQRCNERDGEGEKYPPEEAGEKVVRRRKRKLMRKAELEKERKLRKRDLEGGRKQAHAEKITIPFALKKILVDEWEIVSQCQMVPHLPSKIPVKEVLQRYLQSKLDVLKQKSKGEGNDVCNNNEESVDEDHCGSKVTQTNEGTGDGNKVSNNEEADVKEENKRIHEQDNSTNEQGKEWVDMVEGIAQYFDEALSVRILYWQELGQHMAMMKSKDGELKNKRKCELYGCEHLLRLFVKFPSLLEDSDIPETQKRHIYAKINDLIRFLQKHQDEFFVQAYRKPAKNEITSQKQARSKQARATARNEAGANGERKKGGQKMKTKGVTNPDGVKSTEAGMESVKSEVRTTQKEQCGSSQDGLTEGKIAAEKATEIVAVADTVPPRKRAGAAMRKKTEPARKRNARERSPDNSARASSSRRAERKTLVTPAVKRKERTRSPAKSKAPTSSSEKAKRKRGP